jgi:hypothetical protein
LIFRALEKDRAKRFATAREFAQALERIAPALSDAGGAPPPLPATAEITDEATRMVPKPGAQENVATVMTVEAPTQISDRFLVPPPRSVSSGAAGSQPAGDGLRARRSRRNGFLPIAAVLAIIAGGAGWMLLRARPAPVAPVPIPVHAATMTVSQPPLTTTPIITPGRLGINAFPWATVTSIRNLENGENVDIGSSLVTPAPVDLAPGRYEVTLSNPRFAKQITRTVSIDPGAEATLNVQFSDPTSASLPDFGGSR